MIKITLLLLFLFVIATTTVANATWIVGVTKDDWVQWKITVSGQGQSTTTWIKVTIQGTNTTTTVIKGTYESNQPGWPTDPTDFTVNLLQGNGIASIYTSTRYAVPLIASANLTTGDLITGTDLRIDGTATKDGRDAAFTNIQNSTGNAQYYWDRKTGVLLEYSTSYKGATTLTQTSDTNMWNLSGTNWTPWIVTAIVIVLVVLVAAVVALSLLRRRKLSPKPL